MSRHALCLLLLPLASLGCLTQNPSSFPYVLPAGSIVPTHAKPAGGGFFANFDPNATRLEVRPTEATVPVGTDYVVLATVYDDKGKPRRKRRVEWVLEGTGSLLEVDESGISRARGYKVDNHYAVSYTDFFEHRITRGTPNGADDFVVRPGQSWCVVSSAVEGDSHVTAYAPGIYNWEKHKVNITVHWVDAEWAFPPNAVVRSGSIHALATSVFRHTPPKQPLAGYRVRYRILDGPPAYFRQSETPEAEVVTDTLGRGIVGIAQRVPTAGVNRVAIEVIRAPDPKQPSGTAITLAQSEMTVTWAAPVLAFQKFGPTNAGLNQQVTYTLRVANSGTAELPPSVVRDLPSAGLRFVSAEPRADQQGAGPVWSVPSLRPGDEWVARAVFQAVQPGRLVNQATCQIGGAQTTESQSVTTEVSEVRQPSLKLSVKAPEAATVGVAVPHQVVVQNLGTGPATGVVLQANFDPGLTHESGANPVDLPLGTLPAGEARISTLELTPRQSGVLRTNLVARCTEGSSDRGSVQLVVAAARLGVRIQGPRQRYVNRPGTWTVEVSGGDAGLKGVTLRDRLPPELVFDSATDGGRLANGEVVWALGDVPAGQTKAVRVTARGIRTTPGEVQHVVTAFGSGGGQENATASVAILGLPALRLDLEDTVDPVPVGAATKYRVTVRNLGSLPATNVQLMATLRPQLEAQQATGPSKPTVEMNKVTFPPLSGPLPPGQSVEYIIDVKAAKAGDGRCRVELRADALAANEPLVEEESTNVLGPAGETPEPPRPPGL